MNYDFHAQYALPSRDRETQSVAVDFLTGCVDKPPDKWPELARLEDPAARLEVLAQATVSPLKNRARTGELRGKSGGLWHWLTSRQAQGFLESRMAVFRGLGLLPSLPDLTAFPTGTWGIQLSFKLITPYISLDDTEWHILDNPVKKEKLFKLPCVTPSQWKGALRAAIRRENGWEDDHLNLLRIFGQSRDDEGRKGRIILYPTFFTRIGLEVINPHSRSSGAGKQPIYFECVPAGASGELVMLYVPVDRIGRDETETRDQVAQDLQWIADGTRAMLTVYGFGAKTSSGYGVAELEKGGELVIHYPDEPEKPALPPEPMIPKKVEKFRTQYEASDLNMRIKAWREKHGVSKKARALEAFKAAKHEWLAYQEALKAYQNALEKLETAQTEEPPKTMVRGFDSFEMLDKEIEKISERWVTRGNL